MPDATPGFVHWPEDVARRYRAAGYWLGRPLGTVVADAARAHPDRVAVVDGARRLTYRDLDGAADRLAAGWLARGVGPGDRVLVHLPNVAELVVLLVALLRAGIVPVLALPPHRGSELRHLAAGAGAVAYVGTDAGLAREVAAAVGSVRLLVVVGEPAACCVPFADVDAAPVAHPAPDPSGIALLLLSGGTTGAPKLIPRTHDDYHYNLRASAAVAGLDEHTCYLAALPVAHNFALGCPGVLGTLWAGGRVVLTTSADPETAFALIAAEGVTVTALVPPLVHLWLDAAADRGGAELASLELLQAGGARLKDEAARRVRPELGCALQQVYGMAEGLLNVTRLDDPDEIVHGTQGRPLCADDEIRVVDRAGVPVAGTGELQVRGPYTIRGYLAPPAVNAAAFTPDGFYRTGDLVRRLPGGELVVEGRAKDVINRGGDKVPVEEVENLLLAHPAVHDVAIVGLPDALMGERTCAVVVPRGAPPTRRDLVAHLTALGVAAFKLPDRVRIVEEFPRTVVGKVDRAALAAAVATGSRA